MTKNIKDMSSVEYADYMIQSNRTWKNQQAAAYRKDIKKQQRRSDVKSLLSLASQELVYGAENKLQEMHVKNLPQTINYAANLAKANTIEEERNKLLDKYGTPEQIWQYQAASKSFSAPDIAKYNFKSMDDVSTALTTGLISPEEYSNLNKSYNIELERSQKLWDNGASFDQYDDTYTNTAVTGLTTLQTTKPKNSAIGVLRGKSDEYYDLATTTYNTITEDNTAISQALINRQKIISGQADVKDVSTKTSEATKSSLINSDIPFSGIKRNITDLINKTANEINNPQRVEARFDKLVEEKYKNNETFNATALWQEARRPFEGEINLDKLSNVLNYIDTAKNNYNADNEVIEAEIQERYGWDIDFAAPSALTYATNALKNNVKVSDEIAMILGSTADGKRLLEANPNLYGDTVKAFYAEPTDKQDNYKNEAINLISTIRGNLEDPSFLSKLGIDKNSVENKARSETLNSFFRLTDGATPTYQFGGVVKQMQDVLAKTIYDFDRQLAAGTMTQEEKNTALNLKALEYINNLEIKDKQLIFKPFSDVEFKQLQLLESAKSNTMYNPVRIKGQKALNKYNLAFETFSNDQNNIEAKDEMLSNAAIIIDGITKQNPNLNTIQKLRESSPSMNILLNQIELATPTSSVQEILEYLPVSNEIIAENIEEKKSVTPPATTQTGEDVDNEIKDDQALEPVPAPTPAPSLLAADEDLTGFQELNKATRDRGKRIRKERKSDLKLKEDFRTAIGSLTADLTPRPISFFTQTRSEKTTADKLSVIRDEVKDKFGIDIARVLRRSISLPLVVEQNRQDIPKIIEYIEKRKQEILGG